MDRVEFSTSTRYCIVELAGLPPKSDGLPARFTLDLAQCGPGVSRAGFDKATSKWLVDINDGFPGGTDRVKDKIKDVLAKYDLKATLKEIEQEWTVRVSVDHVSSQDRRSQIERELKKLAEVTNAFWHPNFTLVQLTLSVPFSDQLKEAITHIVTGQSPLF